MARTTSSPLDPEYQYSQAPAMPQGKKIESDAFRSCSTEASSDSGQDRRLHLPRRCRTSHNHALEDMPDNVVTPLARASPRALTS